MSGTGLHWADGAVIAAYLVGVTWLGIRVGRQIGSLSDYFMPRRFGKGMMMMHAFGTGTASDQAVVVASGTFREGLSGIWFQWLWLFNTPFYWLIGPIFRRFRAVTTADVYRLRFGPSVGVLFAVVGIAGLAVKIGLMLKGAGALIEAGTSGAVDAEWAIPLVAVLFVAYGAAGGLRAAILTDFFQGLLTVVFSFMLLPFVMNAVGGIEGIRGTVSDPGMLSLVVPEAIDGFFIATFSVLSLIGIVAQPFIMGVCAAGRTEMDGRFGFTVGNLIKRVCTAAWALTGIGALAWYLQQGAAIESIDPDRAYGEMAREFLPRFFPGLLGLFVASLLAGVMSSCDSFMVSAAGLFTENLYRPLAAGRSDRHYIWVGRGAALVIVVAGALAAFAMPSVVKGLTVWLKIAPMLGISFWMGLAWRRFNAAGAWASTLTGFAGWYVTASESFRLWLSGWSPAADWGIVRVSGESVVLSEPWQIVIYLSLAIVAGIIASLATARPPAADLGRFHDLIRTPVVDGEAIDGPCRLPPGTPPATRPTLLTGTDFEFPVPSRTSVVGFLLAWVAVGAMIAGFAWIVG